MDCSGDITIVDALMIAQHYVGLITSFPCEAVTDFDVCECNPNKCNDCSAQVSACESTSGCREVVECTFNSPCGMPHELCKDGQSCLELLGYEQSSPAAQTASNLVACLGGC